MTAPRRQLQCLLVSPIEPLDSFSGDVIYTHRLLDAPYKNMRYLDYATAQQIGHFGDALYRRRALRRCEVSTNGLALMRFMGRAADMARGFQPMPQKRPAYVAGQIDGSAWNTLANGKHIQR